MYKLVHLADFPWSKDQNSANKDAEQLVRVLKIHLIRLGRLELKIQMA